MIIHSAQPTSTWGCENDDNHFYIETNEGFWVTACGHVNAGFFLNWNKELRLKKHLQTHLQVQVAMQNDSPLAPNTTLGIHLQT